MGFLHSQSASQPVTQHSTDASSYIHLTTVYSVVSDVWIADQWPGTANPLNFIQTTWGIGSVGVNDARNCRPPRFWTWQGTAPSLTIISRLPAPACDASTTPASPPDYSECHRNQQSTSDGPMPVFVQTILICDFSSTNILLCLDPRFITAKCVFI